MSISERRKKVVSLLIVFSLVMLSGKTIAQQSWVGEGERKGVKLKIQKNDGQQVAGELITVKRIRCCYWTQKQMRIFQWISRMLMQSRLVKKNRGFQVGIYGVLAGILYASVTRKPYRYEDKSQDWWTTGLIGGAAGATLGMVLGINKRIQIQGKSDTEIQKTLKKLSKKARVPGIQ